MSRRKRRQPTRADHREAARLEQATARLAGVLDQADRLGEMCADRPQMIERPVKLWQQATPLRRDWADCPICARDVNTCDCDPDAYQAALIARDYPHLLKGDVR